MRSCLGGLSVGVVVLATVLALAFAALLSPSGALPEGCAVDAMPLGGLSPDEGEKLLAEHHRRLSAFRLLVTTAPTATTPVASAALAPLLRPLDELRSALRETMEIPLSGRVMGLLGRPGPRLRLSAFRDDAPLPEALKPFDLEEIRRAVRRSSSATSAICPLPRQAPGVVDARSDTTEDTR